MLDLRFMTQRVHVAVEKVGKQGTWQVDASEKVSLYTYEASDAYIVYVIRAGVVTEHAFPKRNVTHFEAQGPI